VAVEGLSPKLEELRQKFEDNKREGNSQEQLTTLTISSNQNKDGRQAAARLEDAKCTETQLKKVSEGDRKVSEVFDSESECESVNECETESWVCRECNVETADDDSKMLECERCFDRYCTRCLHMGDAVYEYLQQQEPNTLWCCFDCCHKIRATFRKDKTNVDAVQRDQEQANTGATAQKQIDGRIDRIEEKLASMESLMSNMCNYFAGATKNEATDVNRVNSPADGSGQPGQTGVNQRSAAWGRAPTTTATSLRSIIREENEEALKEAERAQRRRKNIVLHRLPELSSDQWSDRRQHDKEAIEELMDALELEV
jgi:hypothetical protein